MPDQVLRSIARQCMEEGSFSRVFCDGTVRTDEEFVVAMKRPSNLPVFAFHAAAPAGFAWLNGITGDHAFGHFCMMKSTWGNIAVDVGRQILDYWMSLYSPSGPVFRTIFGVVPDSNEFAVRYAQKIGLTRLGSVPDMVDNVYEGERESASVLYFSRSANGQW